MSKSKDQKQEVSYPLVVLLEAVLMENGEVLHYGKSLGFVNKEQSDLVEKGATKRSRGNEIVVAIGKKVA